MAISDSHSENSGSLKKKSTSKRFSRTTVLCIGKWQSINDKWKSHATEAHPFVVFSVVSVVYQLPLACTLWATLRSAGVLQASLSLWCDPHKPLCTCGATTSALSPGPCLCIQRVPVIPLWQSVLPSVCYHLSNVSSTGSSWTLATDSLPTAHPVPLSSLAYHTCWRHLFRYLANTSPTAFNAGHDPSGGGRTSANQRLPLDSDTTTQWHLGNIKSPVLETGRSSHCSQDI